MNPAEMSARDGKDFTEGAGAIGTGLGLRIVARLGEGHFQVQSKATGPRETRKKMYC